MREETYKANTIIGNGITLSLQEERAISVCLQPVYCKDGLDACKYYPVPIDEYTKKTGVSRTLAFRELKELSLSLLKAIIRYEDEDEANTFHNVQLVSDVKYNDVRQTLEIKFHKQAIPFLSGFQYGNFTTLHQGMAKFSSTNACNLYQVLKREAHNIRFVVSIEDLQRMLGVSYKLFGDFKAKLLKPCIREIEEKTDIRVHFLIEKIGKKADKLEFIITKKVA